MPAFRRGFFILFFVHIVFCLNPTFFVCPISSCQNKFPSSFVSTKVNFAMTHGKFNISYMARQKTVINVRSIFWNNQLLTFDLIKSKPLINLWIVPSYFMNIKENYCIPQPKLVKRKLSWRSAEYLSATFFPKNHMTEPAKWLKGKLLTSIVSLSHFSRGYDVARQMCRKSYPPF